MSENNKTNHEPHDADDIEGRDSDGKWEKNEGESAKQNGHKSK